MLKAMFNGGEEGKARMEGGGHDKEVASSKFNTSIQKSIRCLWPKWQKWPKSIPYLWPKRLKTLSFGAAHTYIAHRREYPPGMHPTPFFYGRTSRGIQRIIWVLCVAQTFQWSLSKEWEVRLNEFCDSLQTGKLSLWVLTFRVNCRNSLWNLGVISISVEAPRFIFGQFYTRFQRN